MDDLVFPVGYHKLHRKQFFNFQLNRWHSLGYARLEDLRRPAIKAIRTFDDWHQELIALADEALAEGRLVNAAFYYRAAEFYVLFDKDEKLRLYNLFVELFDRAFEHVPFERSLVPYGKDGDALPAIRLRPQGEPKGTVVIHGGFDSWIEEFSSWMRFFAAQGYDVIAFEGPGQGGALKKHGLALDWRWERPAAAVLDFFELTDVTWVGISMGGWFCFRAAAFEKRIKRVIASSIAYDYMKGMNAALRWMHLWFLERHRDWTNGFTKRALAKRRTNLEAWMTTNLMEITGTTEPMDAFEIWLELNAENLCSDKVSQDVLILTGRRDHFIPFKMHQMQMEALTGAKSVTERVFTDEDQAQNHCQIGNVGLALSVMDSWIQSAKGHR